MNISKLIKSFIDLVKWIILNVFVVNNSTLHKIIKELDTLNDEYYIGLDCEWVPGEKDISIIQIATKNYIFIFQMKCLSTIPSQLKTCLENEEIIKSGVGIKNDIDLINKNYEFETKNIVDLMKLHNSLYGINGYGLEKLCNEFLGVNHFKIPINHHNWSNRILTNQQILYASGDAWASREILSSLYYMFVPDELNKDNLFKWVNSIDYSKKQSSPRVRNHHINRENINDCGNEKENKSVEKNNSKQKQKDQEHCAYRTRNHPLYENCHVYHPDGRLMFVCSRRKFNWYLRKSLAVKIAENPPSIQLNFKPNGFGKAVEFMLTPDDNHCVVCGKTEKYVKHSIVPHFYRQWFPFHMKSHCSHDMNCHLKCSEYNYQFSVELHKEYNIEYNNSKVKKDEELNGIIKSAKALVKDAQNIPKDKIEEKYNKIKKYFNKEEITDEDLNTISNLDPKVNVRDKTSGHIIVESILEKEGEEGILNFNMQPKFLPRFWDLNNPVENIEVTMKVNEQIIKLTNNKSNSNINTNTSSNT